MMNKYALLLFTGLLILSCQSKKEEQAQTVQHLENSNPKLAKLKLQPDFKAEHLYSPKEAGQGSWVAMTFDDRDRLIVSDQYGALYRMEIPPIGSDGLRPEIEPLSMQTQGQQTDSILQMGYAQGLLYAFNSLYVMVNHHANKDFDKGSGLYRLQDTDGDDQFDSIKLLKTLQGAGEHGPHSIVLAPDGESLFVIAGNHTDLPDFDSYRLPKVWGEDNLFPQVLDPRGHANDRKAPGGWVAKIDPEGKHWELYAAGFRNPFDLDFNAKGDMFVYDSDMEWDLGMPWYRPTRICHVTSGSEFGWRTGNQKWSSAYPDNLPATLNIGQGSPTNVVFGTGAAFPKRYQESLFAFDWSFGIIYAIQLEAHGASYTAKHEEFLSGIPLPLTDGVFGPDGALYFMTGGRRLDSDLYRVYYTGDADVSPIEKDTQLSKLQQTRRALEAYHEESGPDAMDVIWPQLKSPDRFVQYAARLALEHQPLNRWQDKVLEERNPVILTQGVIALARQGDKNLGDSLLKALLQIPYPELDTDQRIALLRAFELVLYRMGMPSASIKDQVLDYLSPKYPDSDELLNQSLSKLLAYLDDPTVVAKTLTLLEKPAAIDVMANTATDAADLIHRNPQYGMDIAQTLKHMPAAQHTYYGMVLQDVSSGWTPELRKRYFEWFRDAFAYKAGRSYIGFVDHARKKALAQVPKDKFAYYNELSGAELLSSSGNDLRAQGIQPKGPWHNWTLEEIDSVVAGGLSGRDFNSGKGMFIATSCINCHSVQGVGESIGPDLSQLGTRFSPEDILRAIIDPNEVISDQYNTTVYELRDGTSVVGRLIRETEKEYIVSQNPYAPEQTRSVPKAEVLETSFSTISLMPPGTINALNVEELRDLLAFLVAGGNPENALYTIKNQ